MKISRLVAKFWATCSKFDILSYLQLTLRNGTILNLNLIFSTYMVTKDWIAELLIRSFQKLLTTRTQKTNGPVRGRFNLAESLQELFEALTWEWNTLLENCVQNLFQSKLLLQDTLYINSLYVVRKVHITFNIKICDYMIGIYIIQDNDDTSIVDAEKKKTCCISIMHRRGKHVWREKRTEYGWERNLFYYIKEWVWSIMPGHDPICMRKTRQEKRYFTYSRTVMIGLSYGIFWQRWLNRTIDKCIPSWKKKFFCCIEISVWRSQKNILIINVIKQISLQNRWK